MPDLTNVALLLSKLPEACLARRLVAPFENHPQEEAIQMARDILAAVKAAHLKELASDEAEDA